MRASHRVSTFHRRFSTGLIPNPLPTAHHCRVVPPTAVTVYCTKGYCTKGEIETKKVEQSKPQCKKPKSRFYAVLVGREGPKIYLSWKQCEPNVRPLKNKTATLSDGTCSRWWGTLGYL